MDPNRLELDSPNYESQIKMSAISRVLNCEQIESVARSIGVEPVVLQRWCEMDKFCRNMQYSQGKENYPNIHSLGYDENEFKNMCEEMNKSMSTAFDKDTNHINSTIRDIPQSKM